MRNWDETSIGLQPRQRPNSVSRDLACHAAAVFMLHPPTLESKPAALALKMVSNNSGSRLWLRGWGRLGRSGLTLRVYALWVRLRRPKRWRVLSNPWVRTPIPSPKNERPRMRPLYFWRSSESWANHAPPNSRSFSLYRGMLAGI